MSDFPQQLGELTFVCEVEDKKPRSGKYRCSCGTEVTKTLGNANGAKLRSSFSSCAKCRKRMLKRRHGMRPGS